MEISQKWGFGMAPLKPSTSRNNRKAIVAVKKMFDDDSVLDLISIADDISRVKGLFNRVIKQDQWDWFTIYMYFDYPVNHDINCIVSALTMLRRAIINSDKILADKILDQLRNNRFLTYCDNYLSFDIDAETQSEYIYILSRREERDLLKIGMTTRNVMKRVNEINSATGVAFPLSARRVYKVKDGRLAEKEIHLLLSQYRIRVDREFFRINFSDACSIIEHYLAENNQFYYD